MGVGAMLRRARNYRFIIIIIIIIINYYYNLSIYKRNVAEPLMAKYINA